MRGKLLFLMMCLVSYGSLLRAASMRHCLLLPVLEESGAVIGNDVFNRLESFLEKRALCHYQSNSALLDLLQNHRYQLQEQLSNPEVLKLVAQKGRAGSIIKVELKRIPDSEGAEIITSVYGDNGHDIYFREKVALESSDPALLAQTAQRSLEVFLKMIPYEGEIIGLLGRQATIDAGFNLDLHKGDRVEILRPKGVRKHPLLQEVVEWETVRVGEGIIGEVSAKQAIVEIDRTLVNLKVEKGDWVKVVMKAQGGRGESEEQWADELERDHGKIGHLSFLLDFGNMSESHHYAGGRYRSSGSSYGFRLGGEVYFTRSFFLQAQLGKKLAGLEREEGNSGFTTNATSQSSFKVAGGYRYLPMGFFYGPQVDFYLGYGSYAYDVERYPSSGMVDVTYKGILLGVRADIPIYQKIRPFLKIELLFNPVVDEDKSAGSALYGNRKSASSIFAEAGGIFHLTSKIDLYGSFSLLSNSATYPENQSSEIAFKEMGLSLGALYSF